MPKTRNSSPDRDVLGRYAKKCGAVIHNDLDPCSTIYNTIKSKNVNRFKKSF